MISTSRKEELLDQLRRHSVLILIAAVLLIVLLRTFQPLAVGAAVNERELRITDLLKEIHRAEADAVASGSRRFRWLDEICSGAPATSALHALEPAETGVPGVDLRVLAGHLVALYLFDPARNDDRAWSAAMAESDQAGRAGYAAFAWPIEYGPANQWVYFIDQRGKLLGSWNQQGRFDGTNPPFPPIAHPLRDFLADQKDGSEPEWFLFSVLPEIRLPADLGVDPADSDSTSDSESE